uniref:Uncharacterized protein n=1 Tax=Zea mays TaxID=4577 RepID=A0A804NWE5_MAIZE
MQGSGWASGRNGVTGTGGAEQSRGACYLVGRTEPARRQQPYIYTRRLAGTQPSFIPPPWRRTGDRAQARSNGNGTDTGANERGGGKAGDGAGPHECGEAERG